MSTKISQGTLWTKDLINRPDSASTLTCFTVAVLNLPVISSFLFSDCQESVWFAPVLVHFLDLVCFSWNSLWFCDHVSQNVSDTCTGNFLVVPSHQNSLATSVPLSLKPISSWRVCSLGPSWMSATHFVTTWVLLYHLTLDSFLYLDLKQHLWKNLRIVFFGALLYWTLLFTLQGVWLRWKTWGEIAECEIACQNQSKYLQIDLLQSFLSLLLTLLSVG